MIRKATAADIDSVEQSYLQLLDHEALHGGHTNWVRDVYPTRATAEGALSEGTLFVLEEDGAVLRVDCGDPAGTPGQGTETTLWFDCGTHALLRGEIRVDGFRVIGCTCLEFTRG